jgi:uncharacterized glyoxalase superfamily protein PhnB
LNLRREPREREIVDVQGEDAAAEHRRLGSLGVPFTPLIDQPWGERNFTVTDPDGYSWFIGQQLRGAA